MKLNKKEFIEATVLGLSGLIAFTIIAVIVYFIGLSFNFHSLRSGFVAEVVLIRDFPLFFILVALIKILIGGELIDWTTRFFSKILGIKILADKRNPEQMKSKK
jgi:hypothetical protein